ncbi:BQ5605_C014g07585 [Microbotryum silenes-dioicae]|uniref:BQ5605_C014g07585 protein n=1 Tax=Microbotryum silenes-dioicae TaxID=796604 RepID=A0A2X0LTY8_9BASI|nr:BQ5605_C014g07585 [Microbotryum silenes-dioicae]
MFRYPWLAASLALVVFIFSIEVAATFDTYGPVIRECALTVEMKEEQKENPRCNVLDVDPDIIDGCLCGKYYTDVWQQMEDCIMTHPRHKGEDVDWWHEFRCATCRNTNYGNNDVVRDKVCSQKKMPSKARERTKMP